MKLAKLEVTYGKPPRTRVVEAIPTVIKRGSRLILLEGGRGSVEYAFTADDVVEWRIPTLDREEKKARITKVLDRWILWYEITQKDGGEPTTELSPLTRPVRSLRVLQF